MRKTYHVLAASLGVLALALTGCSSSQDTAEPQVLSMFASSDFKAAVDPLVKDFEAANPGVTVNVTYAGGNDFTTTEGTAIASGNAPDIIDALPGTDGAIATQQLIKDGTVLDLSDQSWAKDVPASVNGQNQPDMPDNKKVYFYPVLVQPMGAFYNAGALAEAGLTAPTTWSGVLQFCADARKAGKIPFSLGIQDNWITQLIPYTLVNSLLYSKDPAWGRNGDLASGKVKFTDSAWVETFVKYDQMRKANCFTEAANAVNLDGQLAPVAEGKALGMVQVGGLFGNLQKLNAKAEYTLAALPATDNPDETYMPAAPAHEFAVNAKSKNKELALKFLDFLAEPKNVNKFVLTVGGAVVAIPNDSFVAPALLSEFYKFVQNDRIRAFPYLPNVEVQNAILVGTQNMFLDKLTPQQLVQNMQDAIKKS